MRIVAWLARPVVMTWAWYVACRQIQRFLDSGERTTRRGRLSLVVATLARMARYAAMK